MVVSPLLAAAVVAVILDENRERGALFSHTEYRKNMLSKIMVMLGANLMLVVLTVKFLLAVKTKLAIAIVILGFAGITACVIAISMVVAQQQKWKEYWGDRLLELMALADHDKNHDLFNRAMILGNYIDSQPDIPIPGRLGFYTAVYSLVQTSIIFLARSFHLS